ncbi:MAG: outer membrane beta-barrel protein [Saprospiraceae bacterium]|nr:outer membrane beta-barrel protein [Saprospiraceae bacterium]
MNILKYIVVFNFLIISEIISQNFTITAYLGSNRTSISNILLKNRSQFYTNPEFGVQLGLKVDYLVTSRMKFVSGLGISNRVFSEKSRYPGQPKYYERMYFVEIPMMLRLPLKKKFYTNFGLVHSYKFAGDTHFYWDNQNEILYGLDLQILCGYKLNKKFGIEAGALYGSLLDHALGRLNFTNFVGSLCLTYKLK